MESQARATILLVEDDPGVARLEQLRLERAGFRRASPPRRPRKGSSRSPTGEIDLIILDQRLSSGASGLEFFRQVKEAGPQRPGHPRDRLERREPADRGPAPACATSCPRRRTSSTISSRS